jgi:hypothetical protein
MLRFAPEFLHELLLPFFDIFNATNNDEILTSQILSFEKNPQKFLSSVTYNNRFNELISSSTCARDLILLKHARSPHASDWLHQLPRFTSEMPSQMWITAFRHHFGIPVYLSESLCLCCKGVNDIYGDHACGCGTGYGDSTCPRTHRHNTGRFILNAVMVDASWTTSVETRFLLQDNLDARPADIFVQGVRNECIDLTVVDSVGDWSTAQDYDPADQLIKAANAKHVKYDASCRRENLAFTPFAMGSLGGFGDEALEIIYRVAESQCRLGISHYSRNELAQFICQRLSFQVRKSQAKSILERTPMVVDDEDDEREDEREGVGEGYGEGVGE